MSLVVNLDRSRWIHVHESIHEAGYSSPATDTDDRLRGIWEKARLDPLVVPSFCANFDYTKIVEYQHPFMRFFQSRASNQGDLDKRIKDNVDKFYVRKESLKRTPMLLLRDGEYFPAVGNGRAYTFKLKEDNSKGAIVFDCSAMTEQEFKAFGHSLACDGNTQTEDDVIQETGEDMVQQLRTYVELSDTKDWHKQHLINKCHKWLQDNKYSTKGDAKKSFRTKIINKALEEGHSSTIPMPLVEELDGIYKQFWPHSDWHGEYTNPNKKTAQHVSSSNETKIKSNFDSIWRNTFPSQATGKIERKHLALMVRIGNTNDASNITLIETVSKGRTKTLNFFKEYNCSTHSKQGGCPLVTRVVFLKQLLSLDDEHEAWEWEYEKEEFVKVSKSNLSS